MSIGMSGENSSGLLQSTPSPEQVKEQVERILQSKSFDASERNRTFLRYVVDETLAGRANYIKGYTVARGVFHRDPDFDPQLDPVVRIEASRLRRSLERYYLTAGKHDVVVVELPKGGYVPRFELNPETGARADLMVPCGASSEALWPKQVTPAVGPSIILSPFENLSGNTAFEALAQGITEELVARLTRYEELTVRATTAPPKPKGTGADNVLAFALRGSIRAADGRLRVTVRLLDNDNGTYLWAESFDWTLGEADIWSLQEQVADKITTQLAGAYGAIAGVTADRIAQRTPPDAETYELIIRVHTYRQHFAASDHGTLRAGLERAVRRDPGCADAWAYLAIIYVDEHRFGFNRRAEPPAPLVRALAAAQRSLTRAGHSAVARIALSLVYHYLHRYEESCALAREALALNPNRPEVVGQAAIRLALGGYWAEAAPFLKWATDLDPDRYPLNHLVLALEAYRRNDNKVALREARRAAPGGLSIGFGILAAICADLGLRRDASSALDAACSDGKGLSHLRQEIECHIHDDVLVRKIRNGLEKAGSALRPRSVR